MLAGLRNTRSNILKKTNHLLIIRHYAAKGKGKALSEQEIVHTPSPDGQLPALEEWRLIFPVIKPRGAATQYRPVLHNLDTAKKLVKDFGFENVKKPKVILEVFAGPGTLSRALCSLPPSKVKKIIVLENNPHYLPYLESLAAVDNRVVVRPYDAWHWDSYTKVIEEGLLDDVQIENWDRSLKDVHPSHSTLHFLASALPWAETGEGFFNQMFRAIPTRDWVFKYGAVPLSLVIPESFWRRAAAPVNDRFRCKLSCMVEATTKAEQIKEIGSLSPHPLHFFPGSPPTKSKADPLMAATFRPLGYQAMRLAGVSEWDFVLRSLFIHKKTPIVKGLKFMAPGAANLAKYVDPKYEYILNYAPAQMKIQDWAILLEAFKNWPFAPTDIVIPDAPAPIEKRL